MTESSKSFEDHSLKPRLAVVVPMANEEDTVDAFLKRLSKHLYEEDHVFCVLDNVSHDSTRQKIEQWSARDSRVELVWAPENRCVVDAYFRGYRAALTAGYEWILEMDGGFSHDPDLIPQFREAMKQGYDYAGGSRFIEGGKHNGPLMRYLVSWGGTWLTNLLLGTRMKDMTSGFECFTHDSLSYVVGQGVQSRAHFFQTEIRYMLHDKKWIEIPIIYRTSAPQVGTSSLTESIRILWSLRRKQRHKRKSPRPS